MRTPYSEVWQLKNYLMNIWGFLLHKIQIFTKRGLMQNYSKTLLFQTKWEQTIVQISGSLNYRSATESMFRGAIKWTSRVFLGNTTLFSGLEPATFQHVA
jgi:hypothetical protein